MVRVQVRCRAADGCPADSLRPRRGCPRPRRRSTRPEPWATTDTANGTWPRSPDSVGCRRSGTLIRFTCATAEGRRSSAT